MLQDVINLLVDGQQLNLSFSGDHETLFSYIHQVMTSDQICVLRDPQNKVRGLFRGNKISGAYLSTIDSAAATHLLRLQIENLQLQNKQLKTLENGESWRGKIED